ncbi:MAG: nickel-responsive transcriptional regulator NikR [Alphaproteobacteria bacterium]|nr:nickel-responsive transcriptional regulator NikR [Alphaproteobacteria bacterium]
MDRFTVSLDEELLARFDDYVQRKGYQNRSEAVRDILRDRLEAERLQTGTGKGHCIASLSYIYNHHERELSRRLTQAQHAHHDLTLSTLHVHLDHENCMEVAVLRGPTSEVKRFADEICAETGVRHGKLNAVPVDLRMAHSHHSHGGHAHEAHDHGHGHKHGHEEPHAHQHLHSVPKS